MIKTYNWRSQMNYVTGLSKKEGGVS